MKMLHLTHDLSCVFTDLGRAARRYAGSDGAWGSSTLDQLAIAAVAFTIQLAIDEGDRDPSQMRALERELIEKLRAGS